MREMSLVPRSSSPLAQKRHIKLNEVSIASTPLLVPSFSSKGFPEVDRLIKSSAEIITDTCLVSAYDISYGLIPDNLSFAEFLFLDSGGYDSCKDLDFSDLGYVTEDDPKMRAARWKKPL